MAKAARRSNRKKSKPSNKDHSHQLAKIVGALCLSASLREAFFGAEHLGSGRNELEARGLLRRGGPQKSKPEVLRAVEKMFAAQRGAENSVQACADCLARALMECLRMPCPDWPC